MPAWFDVDKEGLGRLLERRGPEFLVFELVQNALDQVVTRIKVTLTPVAGRPLARLVVEDDDPQGFADLTHAFTLFAKSGKTADPERRGRFNLGEKLVLAACEEATITTTTGGIRFDAGGRHRLRRRRARGSRFEGLLRMTREQLELTRRAVPRLIPPPSIELVFEGARIPPRVPLQTFEVVLVTEVADAAGILRRRPRRTAVHVHEPRAGEPAGIYELGIPVVETGDRWHYDVQQKVPLNLDRDNVTPAYLRALRTAAFNALHVRTTGEDCNRTWVREALADRGVTPEAVRTAVQNRFGERVVAYDPSDPEANALAVTRGYVVVHGGQLSAAEWENVRAAEALPPAGQVTPSPKPFHPDGQPLALIPEDGWTEAMRRTAAYAQAAAREILEVPSLQVAFANDRGWPFGGAYEPGRLIVNLARRGKDWCDRQGPAGPEDRSAGEDLDRLLIHEFAHHYTINHLSAEYHQALARVGARLKAWALADRKA